MGFNLERKKRAVELLTCLRDPCSTPIPGMRDKRIAQSTLHIELLAGVRRVSPVVVSLSYRSHQGEDQSSARHQVSGHGLVDKGHPGSPIAEIDPVLRRILDGERTLQRTEWNLLDL